MLSSASYRELLGLARRHARKAADAEDLLHDALTAAIVAGRPAGLSDRAWLSGVMRKMAAMQRRSAARRRRREQDAAGLILARAATDPRVPSVPPLPPGLRIVLLLALSGHNRAEIRYLLGIGDDALRQRLAEIRRRVPAGCSAPREFPALAMSALAYGAIRQSLLPLVRSRIADLASHDPDGHALAIRILRPAAHKTEGHGNKSTQTSTRE